MYTYSKEHLNHVKRIKKEKRIILIVQIGLAISFLILWQLLANLEMINTFLTSSPKEIVETIKNLIENNNLFNHIFATIYETLISFTLATLIGIIVATILWWNKTIAKIIEPYLTIINSIPKVALGPLIIIWIGADTSSIIFMALLICVFISVINIYNAFISTNNNYIKILKSFNASKTQIFINVVIPNNMMNIVNTMKVNISMSLVGVIMGELLVSKEGLGYLIIYGSQVFNINLVITSVVILALLSWVMYYIIIVIQKKLIKER